jgi:hypothetical protein
MMLKFSKVDNIRLRLIKLNMWNRFTCSILSICASTQTPNNHEVQSNTTPDIVANIDRSADDKSQSQAPSLPQSPILILMRTLETIAETQRAIAAQQSAQSAAIPQINRRPEGACVQMHRDSLAAITNMWTRTIALYVQCAKNTNYTHRQMAQDNQMHTARVVANISKTHAEVIANLTNHQKEITRLRNLVMCGSCIIIMREFVKLCNPANILRKRNPLVLGVLAVAVARYASSNWQKLVRISTQLMLQFPSKLYIPLFFPGLSRNTDNALHIAPEDSAVLIRRS